MRAFVFIMAAASAVAEPPEVNLLSIPRAPLVLLGTNWVTNTWTFTGSSDLADAGNSATISAIYTNDGGALYFTNFVKSDVSKEYARRSAAGQNWTTWGVPSGANVDAVVLAGYSWKLAVATKLTTHTNIFRLMGDDLGVMHSGTLLSSNMPIVAGGWSNVPSQAIVAITPGYNAALTDVRLEVEYGLKTGSGSGGANVQFGFDNIKIGIRYYTNQP